MCGRCRCTIRAEDVPRACYRDGAPVRDLHVDRYRPSYNVSPGSNMPVLRRDSEADGNGVAVHCMKWGLIPSFTKKTEKPDFYKMFNARSESVSEKASFRRLLPKNRCLVAVEGFYEWKKDGSKKQPYYVHFKDGRPLVFAALYDSWKSAEGETLDTFTILTTSSSSALQWLHDRMPVILGDNGSTNAWLDGSSTSTFNALLKPYENADLVWYPVTPGMGKPGFQGPECIKEIPLKVPKKNSISKFFTAQPKEEEMKREDESSCGVSPVNINQEPSAEEYKELASSGRTLKREEPDEENSTIPDISVQMNPPKILKDESPTVDGVGITSFIDSVKEEPAVGKMSMPDEAINTDHPKLLKDEHETEGCINAAEVKESNLKTVSPESLEDEAKTEDQTGASSREMEKDESKNPAKRDLKVFSEGKKPSKQAENVERRQSKKQRHPKSSDNKQSTLLSFFGKKDS